MSERAKKSLNIFIVRNSSRRSGKDYEAALDERDTHKGDRGGGGGVRLPSGVPDKGPTMKT